MPTNFGAGDLPSAKDKGSVPVEKKAAIGSSPAPSFLKKGTAAQAALKADEARAEARAQEQGKLWRFYIPKEHVNVDYEVTFLDGGLDSEGLLDLLTWSEHDLMIGNKVQRYICTGEHEPCPICAMGKDPSVVAGLTVIDHTQYVIKSGERKGETVSDKKKLFVVKRGTIGALQKIATKFGPLRGMRVKLSRTGSKTPQVGDSIMPDAKYSEEELRELFAGKPGPKGEAPDGHLPADYERELTYYTAKELVEMGVAPAIGGVSANLGPSPDLSKEL